MIRPKYILFWVSLFSIAMGYLESSVVVYLREIMYPAGFSFPLVPMTEQLAYIELFRELSTLLMLIGIGMLAGRTRTEKFAYFLYSFGIWDIFYYVFLKIILDWPDSLLTWDILFLIPVTWTGPVIAPLITSLSMILLALILILFIGKHADTKLSRREWLSFMAGAFLVFLAYVWDYARYILTYFSARELLSLPGKQALYDLSVKYIPQYFSWVLFLVGEVIILMAVGMLVWRMQRNTNISRQGR